MERGENSYVEKITYQFISFKRYRGGADSCQWLGPQVVPDPNTPIKNVEREDSADIEVKRLDRRMG
jgi:hypothetical protein